VTATCAHPRCGREIRQTATGWGHTSPARLFFHHEARPTPGSGDWSVTDLGRPAAGTGANPSTRWPDEPELVLRVMDGNR
jgi:hypothetical protein